MKKKLEETQLNSWIKNSIMIFILKNDSMKNMDIVELYHSKDFESIIKIFAKSVERKNDIDKNYDKHLEQVSIIKSIWSNRDVLSLQDVVLLIFKTYNLFYQEDYYGFTDMEEIILNSENMTEEFKKN